jgi:hypothetical protein
MGQRSVRVVVGQGDLDHAGSLRAVLERDDVDVVGEASNASQLARVLTDEQPDIVVLDDVIGISAVELATQIVPDARLIVVWPAAVMPIAGAVRVEPAEVGTTLAATVALAAGLRGLGGIDRPDWIDRVKKDPATLREMLAARGAAPARPSVTELQRRGHRLHPSPSASKRAARETDAAAAAVVPIGLAASQREEAPADAADAAAAATVAPAVLSSAWNRRLGIISLGGAAAAGALMIALALGPHGSSITSAEPFPLSTGHGGGPAITLGGEAQPPGDGGPTTTGGGGDTSVSGNGSNAPSAGPGSTGGASPQGSLGGLGGGNGDGSSGGTGGSGSGTGGAGSPAGPRSSSSHLPGAHGTGKPGAPGWQGSAPGGSGDHNPHGGPPGHDPGHGQASSHGSGQSNGQGSGGGNDQGNGNAGGGQGVTHGNGGGRGHAGGSHGASSGSHGNGHANGHSAGHGNAAAAHRHKR